MVTTHKISAGLYDDSFRLIVLHCSLENHAMAYSLNRHINLRLTRSRNDLDLSDATFPIFEWKDELNECQWTLFCNKSKEETKSESVGFFSGTISTKTNYLIEERKEADYFLKADIDDSYLIDKTIKAVQSISSVVAAYSIDSETLKSKRNLIF